MKRCSVCAAAYELVAANDSLRVAVRTRRWSVQLAHRSETANHVWDAVRNNPHTRYRAPTARKAS